jgi:hypothetical protein
VTAKPAADGSIHLRAADCEIHGGEMAIEPEFQNLGMWHGGNDQAVWTMEITAAGRYRVELQYACDGSSAGNTLELEDGDAKLTYRVAGTGRWSDYIVTKIGEMALRSGSQRLVVKPAAPLHGALLDLKEIRLVPAK